MTRAEQIAETIKLVERFYERHAAMQMMDRLRGEENKQQPSVITEMNTQINSAARMMSGEFFANLFPPTAQVKS